LQKDFLVTESSAAAGIPQAARELCDAIDLRYEESGAARFGMSREMFRGYVAAVVERYGAGLGDGEKMTLVCSLRVEELVHARACSAGNDAAWEVFLARYRGELYRAAVQIAHDDAAGRELADELYAELYGMPNQEGRRVSKFDYYMGRGSLAGWLRTVLAQRHVDRFRSRARDVSLDDQLESGVAFAAKTETPETAPDDRVAQAVGAVLQEQDSEGRFLLASYYLDRRRLAEIGLQLGAAESTISRRLKRLTSTVRKRIRKRLVSGGMDARRCDEIMEEIDVRDLNVDVERNLRQEKKIPTF
jgi:RNA polymerase sigma-70 factor (ECF subfamily)